MNVIWHNWVRATKCFSIKKLGLKSTKAEKTIGEMKEKYFSLVQMSLELRN